MPCSRDNANCNALRLPPGQPMLLLDDLWISSRAGTARRLIPAQQLRVVNDSFPVVSPTGGQHYPYMEDNEEVRGSAVPHTSAGTHTFAGRDTCVRHVRIVCNI